MKILVMSDMHGLISYGERIIEKEKPDEVIFLGDGLRDMKRSAAFFKNIRFHYVKGNCDFYDAPEKQQIKLGGKNIFFTHGHLFNVKMERELRYITLRSYTASLGAQIVLFGHTHQPDLVYADGMCMMNPGAVMAGKYGVLEINGESIRPELRSL